MKNLKTLAIAISASLLLSACQPSQEQAQLSNTNGYQLVDGMQQRLDIYYPVELSADLSSLSDNQKAMIAKLIDASKIMDDLFWLQAYGTSKEALLNNIDDPAVRQFADINYGPWDRLNGDKPFLKGVEEKPLGAAFYPADMTKQEFAASDMADPTGLYSLVKRNEQGQLLTIPYSHAYQAQLEQAAALLREAATLADNQAFSDYLSLRAEALVTDQYQASDMAWMDMKTNPIELVIGPIENYEDQLYGYRAAFESYVLLKDMAWSDKLARFAQYLPELQQNLPVDVKYKQEMPGTDADLNAYDVLYYAGHSNAGSKTIAINLPNDEQVQLEKGTRRLQLKNAMRAKFDYILMPISEQLIAPEQRQHITFDAFFANTMFHEVAHGLGIKNTLDGSSTVRGALKEHASALEEGKADILGLYMVQQLLAKGVINEGVLEDYYVTFMAGIFRSVRFGASSAHGKANMIRFNFFQEYGAFSRDENGLYRVNMDKMNDAVAALSELILTLQGNGDYAGVSDLVATKGVIQSQLQEDLAKLTQANIPVDITFIQGKQVLNL